MVNNKTIEYIRSKLNYYNSPVLVDDGEKAWNRVCDLTGLNPIRPSDVYYDDNNKEFVFFLGTLSEYINIRISRKETDSVSVVYEKGKGKISIRTCGDEIADLNRLIVALIFSAFGFIEDHNERQG